MKTKFYEFSQNNTGGGFDVDDKLCHRLYIEAIDLDSAVIKAEELGCYWNGCDEGIDCSCCGDRWYKDANEIDLEKNSKSYSNEFENIEEYAQFIANGWGWCKPDSRIFYIDGKVIDIYTKET